MSKAPENKLGRRALLQSAGGVAALGVVRWAHAAGPRRRFAIVGMGSRSSMYVTAVTETFRDRSELVGVCDTNPGRLELARAVAARAGATPKAYRAADFDKLLAELKP